MGKNKNWCTKCTKKHYPPTGKKCIVNTETQHLEKAAGSVAVGEGDVVQDCLSSRKVSKSLATAGCSTRASTTKKDLFVDGPGALGHGDLSDSSGADSTDSEEDSVDVQARILQELQKMNSRLHVVEKQVAEKTSKAKKDTRKKLSTVGKFDKSDCKVKQKSKYVVCTDESSEDSDFPSLYDIKTSKAVQRKIDRSLTNLDTSFVPQGNENAHKLKSKRGGPVDVVVNKKVAWPHEHILGGLNRQRVTYDQLTLTQFIQGFVKNIIDESDRKCKDKMLHYLGDLMEDATDFSWSSAKSAHAVLLCEMERGSVDWFDTTRIDRIRRAHAQRHNPPSKQNWQKSNDQTKKPWFCKAFQSGLCSYSKDHEQNGKTHRHVCAHCLAQGRILTHSEKDCLFLKKTSNSMSKNEHMAAQQH